MHIFNYIYKKLYSKLYIVFKRWTGNNIESSGFIKLSDGPEIKIDQGAILKFLGNVTFERNITLLVRKNAEVIFGKNVYVNRNCIIVSHKKIIIGDKVTIGPNCCFYDHDHDLKTRGSFISEPIYIKNNVWIGAGVLIMKGVTIGENSVVSGGCVVTKDVPDNTILIQRKTNVYKEL